MSKQNVTEAIRILLGKAPEECVEYVSTKVEQGEHLAHAVGEWLKTKKLVAAERVEA